MRKEVFCFSYPDKWEIKVGLGRSRPVPPLSFPPLYNLTVNAILSEKGEASQLPFPLLLRMDPVSPPPPGFFFFF